VRAPNRRVQRPGVVGMGRGKHSFTFSFDAVFDEGCAQGDVFQHALPHLIDGLFSGYVGNWESAPIRRDHGQMAQPVIAVVDVAVAVLDMLALSNELQECYALCLTRP
jgi:hypothetical protein